MKITEKRLQSLRMSLERPGMFTNPGTSAVCFTKTLQLYESLRVATSRYEVGIDDALLNTKSAVTEEPWH